MLSEHKLYYQRLYEKDAPFVWRYGNPQEIKAWRQSGEEIPKVTTEQSLKNIATRLGKIREDIHSRNENDTGYRLMYLQKGPETVESIREKLGPDIARVVENLRRQ